ncbi:MAG: right-handed parallel beta-helix repeat-containing protein [Armatimonadota bacterium]|jgi:hypothetical protein
MRALCDPWVIYAATVAVLLVASGHCLGAQVYLSPEGDDDAAGTRAAPWRSIERANAALGPGDTGIFLPGTYGGTIAPARNGEPEAPIRYRSDTRHGAVLVGSGPDGPAIEFSGRSHVAVEGFRVAPGDGRWLRASGCDHIEVRDCYMEKSGGSTSLVISASRQVRLIDNAFTKDRVSGNMCDVLGCTHVVIEGNSFTRVGHCPLRLESAKCAVVRANCFHNCWGRNYEFVASGRVLVERNIITRALDSAHSADSRAKNSLIDSVIRLNRAFRNWHTPLNSPSYVPVVAASGRVWEPFRLVDTRVYHNTITDNLGYGWQLAGMNISANVFANNIFFRNDKHGGGVQLDISDAIAEDNQFLNNLFCGTQPGQHTVRYGEQLWTAQQANDGTPVRRGGWTQFDGNVDVDPGFVDAANGDFRLREGSDCIDAGHSLTRTIRAGQGRELPVADARYFFDGFGIEGEPGDLIAIGAGDNVARIERIEFNYYQPDIILLDRDMTWEAKAPVSLPWSGRAPDIGAHQRVGPLLCAETVLFRPAYPRPGEAVQFGVVFPGEVEAITWNFGDSTTAQGAAATHTYQRPGQYCARARLRYRHGHQDVAVAFVKVAAPPDPRAPMLTVDFEDETLLEWGYLFKFYRQRNTGFERVGGGFQGGKCMRLFAEANGSILGCALAPGEWDIDVYPLIRFAYRIPEGVPVGLYLQAFPSEEYGEGGVIVGGTASRAAGSYPDLDMHKLVDDGAWHEATIDARAIREVIKGVKYLRRFRFYTHNNAAQGHEFWFDDFRIVPGE